MPPDSVTSEPITAANTFGPRAIAGPQPTVDPPAIEPDVKEQRMEDQLICGGWVIDGNGTPARRADVAIRNGRITAVSDCEGLEAQGEIDASGQIVAAGFIDIHTHSDFTLPRTRWPRARSARGTTEVVGNCGYSTAPVLPGKAEALQEYLRAGAPWLDYELRTFAQYLDNFPATAVSMVMQVGHATLCVMAMGLEAGALGMSTGLFTAPVNHARSEELLACVVASLLGMEPAYSSLHIQPEVSVHLYKRLLTGTGQ